jgi:hypothetical protein
MPNVDKKSLAERTHSRTLFRPDKFKVLLALKFPAELVFVYSNTNLTHGFDYKVIFTSKIFQVG